MATTTRQRHLPSRHKRPTTRRRPRTRRSYGIKCSPTTKRNTTRITRTSYGPRRQVNRIQACVVPRMHTGKPTRTTSRHKVGGECSFDVKIANDMYRTQVVRISATDPGVTQEQLDAMKSQWRKNQNGWIIPDPGLEYKLSNPDQIPIFDIQTGLGWDVQGWLKCVDGEYQCYIGIYTESNEPKKLRNLENLHELLCLHRKYNDLKNKANTLRNDIKKKHKSMEKKLLLLTQARRHDAHTKLLLKRMYLILKKEPELHARLKGRLITRKCQNDLKRRLQEILNFTPPSAS